ncbi:MAG: DUF2339 domain-containing protein, partial [Pseudomonadota bacterium]
MIALLILGLIVLTIGALLGIVSTFRVSRLRQEIVDLRADVAALRQTRDRAERAEEFATSPKQSVAPDPMQSEGAPASARATPPPSPPLARGEDVAQPSAPPPPPPPSSTFSPPPPPPPRSRPSTSGMGFEDRLGSQLTVWIGGLALALGGIFLVRYTIDAGLLGPGARVVLGALLAGGLLWLGEITRREEVVGTIAERLPRAVGQLPHAYIPGILTAAGLMTAFATAFAAYALYGFLGDVVAFALLALISFAGLALSVRHGPWIATLGLLGAYVTPALVASNAPSAWSLFLYLLIVTGAVYLTAWFRGWARLAYLGCAGAVGWGILWLAATYSAGDNIALAVFCVGLPALALIFLRDETAEADGASRETEETVADDEIGDDVSADASNPLVEARKAIKGQGPLIPVCIANAALTILFVQSANHNAIATLATALVCGLFLASASHWRTLMPLAAVAGSLFVAHLFSWPGMIGLFETHLPDHIDRAINPSTTRPSWFSALGPDRLLRFAILGSLAFGGLGLWHTFTRRPHAVWAGIATAVPLAAFIITYLRIGNLSASVSFGLAGLLIAAGYAAISDRLDRRVAFTTRVAPFAGWSVGAFAAATCGFLALAFTVSLSKGWLTIAFALMAPAMAWIATRRPIPILRWVAAGLAALVVLRLIYDPRIVGSDLGTTPILNWILIGYGIPTLAFAAAAALMLRTRDDLPAQIVRATAIAFSVTFISMEIRHLMNGGDVFATPFGLAEVAVQSLAWLGMSLGLRWGSFARSDGLMLQAANVIGLVAIASLAFAHLVV